jgi:predicted metal-dependent peptidase
MKPTSYTDDPLAALERAARMQKLEEDAAKQLRQARTRLVLGTDAAHVFFATLALRLNPQSDPRIETAATDGKRLLYNPAWLAALSLEEAEGVVCHEVLHNALCHHARRQGRDQERWNRACDLAVNPTILESGLRLPHSRLLPGEGQYAHLPPGQSAEVYYNLLQGQGQRSKGDEQAPEGGGGGPDDAGGPGQVVNGEGEGEGQPAPDPGGCGGVLDPGDGSQAALRQSEAEWAVAAAQAQQTAKGRGELPGGIDRLIEALLRPKVSWKEVLREFVSRHARNDYSWAAPNRRFLHQGLYLPGLRSEELGDIVLAIDTSGSIGQRELAEFAGEAQGILDAYDCSLTILFHDSAVRHVQRWEPSDGPLILEPKGGGGTSHECVFEWIEAEGVSPTCLVCLTDLHTVFPNRGPDYPTLWVVSGGNETQPPFGERVTVNGC